MSLDPTRPVMSFDVGARRIGVAVGSAFGEGSKPIGVVMVHAAGPDWQQCEKWVREWRPAGFVVGDPLTIDGGDQPSRQRARRFAQDLVTRFKKPVVMMDERTSSIEAAQRFAASRAGGNAKRQDAELLDAWAAAVILDRWLASPQDGVELQSQGDSKAT